MTSDLEAMAETLAATGNYRVLRRLAPRRSVTVPNGQPTKLAIFLDVETTGLSLTHDEVIEIAFVPFTYGADGRIYEILPPFEALQQPSRPLPPEIAELTGLTDEMLAGQAIDQAALAAVAAPAALIIAHNAAFDRPFAERLNEVFIAKPWACSQTQVPWLVEGLSGGKLRYLASDMGFFFDGHRAAHDCAAAIELLTRPLPRSGQLALAALLETARQKSYRIWAEGSPYDLKDALKARGYRWHDGTDGRPRAWYRDVSEEARATELDYLAREIYQRDIDPLVTPITAYERFSNRV